MPYVAEARVVLHEEVAPRHFRMAVRAPEIAAAAKPGQFAMLLTARGYYPFLRRPMSFERIFADGLSFLFKVEGEGTRLMSELAPGQHLSIHGPLGNGFPIDASLARHIVVAGGMGVAPCVALAEGLIQTCKRPPEVILGARTRGLLLCESDFRRMGCAVHVVTDDGSSGERALASDVLERLAPEPGARVYACGPMPMLAAVARLTTAWAVDCRVSLEAQMACGDGACLGCVVESRAEKEGERMVRVCADGPVFDATLIDWSAHDLAYDR